MLFIPVSFVAALVNLVAVVRLWRDRRATGPLLPALLLVLAVLAVLLGLRWGYGITRLMPLQAALALAGPPLAVLAFRRLGEQPRTEDLVHAVPVFVFYFAGTVAPPLFDIVIPLQAFAYALLALRLALSGPDGLPGARLTESVSANRALWICAVALALSGLTDVGVAIDYVLSGGQRAATLVAASQSLALIVAGLAVALAGRSAPAIEETADPEPVAQATEDDVALVDRLERLIHAQGLHCLPDLTLNRLARRAQVPARQVSNAVNRVRGESVSRFLNRIRVEEACRLLAGTDDSVTEVMGAAGFQTKSNFNRAFREVTGQGPAEWRQSRRSFARTGGDGVEPAAAAVEQGLAGPDRIAGAGHP